MDVNWLLLALVAPLLVLIGIGLLQIAREHRA